MGLVMTVGVDVAAGEGGGAMHFLELVMCGTVAVVVRNGVGVGAGGTGEGGAGLEMSLTMTAAVGGEGGGGVVTSCVVSAAVGEVVFVGEGGGGVMVMGSGAGVRAERGVTACLTTATTADTTVIGV